MKSVKPSVDILEGLSTGVNMDVSAPHLIHKWPNEPRQLPSFMLGGLGKRKVTVTFFEPHALACRRNLWRDLKILVTLRTAVLQVPSKSYENRRELQLLCNFLETKKSRGNETRSGRTG